MDVRSSSNRPPYSSYAAIFGTFLGGLAAVGALARSRGREPQPQSALDVVLLAGATFKTARTLSHDRITSFARLPFVEGEADAEDERPTGEGMQRAIGELVTCTRCVGTWAAAGLVSTQLAAPRFGRVLTWTLGAAAASDFLQAGFVALCQKADAAEAKPPD
ncbi:MAG: DUF1360 domain-containing protein [Actinobacteria bacterium]|nr:DUF1360 domain-containing protein [Actinomycetota bacterium]